ncbi:phosphoglycerate mutase [Campylobacter blaseri]|uniref:2,3-bisphosphoglycerate-independent phosphoglycerate mutase n=1 Tax=Campylobacter blaseri TaxID=2042961 RepID=A0A2P8R1B0_9BACT|nr:2,3-bisphosphoglycerate-independent phosphoglycerate mutase [Campylobacter blaseri]PSM52274.1 phosphoglycerate mutase (2,3-diphosphoglycerate-independent) [Campylobacter blaseri]PSM54040.1 phosphoglycerate mutase (2,3-diphosphoglycerate-independent) [Campylobacter blaseri]QKF85481.1 phosphoglycerate mutase [Campylobacter blaseri]
MAQKTILVITDGIGYNENDKFNAFANAKKPTYNWLFQNSANSMIKTSGLAVGLPEGQMGNSEVGHMSIGSGRILYQNLIKIDKAIKNDDFKKNSDLINLVKKTKRIHIIGLYSDGGVHSHLKHFDYFYKFAKDLGKEVFAHAITDGRDVGPKSSLEFIKHLEENANLATLSGRFYAMDRDKRWERVEKAYKVIVDGENLQSKKPSEYIFNSYKNDITDEFIKPASFMDFGGIQEEDCVIFINFRNDRVKEIINALSSDEFSEFKRKNIIKNIITMTNYDDKFNFPVLIKNENIKNTLSDVISNAGLAQLHTAETEKYAHVTFFFNGGKEEPVLNETRVLVPSPKVKTYDEKPQMSAYEVCNEVIRGIENGEDFIVVNFANGDMVGHTGNYEASIKAVEVVDECLGQIVKKAQEHKYAYMQISDHGNCESMKDEDGNMLTNHTTFDVFCFVLADGVDSIKNGRLSNVAPTILKIMGLEIPKEMDEALF